MILEGHPPKIMGFPSAIAPSLSVNDNFPVRITFTKRFSNSQIPKAQAVNLERSFSVKLLCCLLVNTGLPAFFFHRPPPNNQNGDIEYILGVV